MKKMLGVLAAVAMVCMFAANANAEEYGGIEFPAGEASFADEVVSFIVGAGTSEDASDPERTLGIPDWPGTSACALGRQGELVLRFLDNSLTTSGDDSEDLWIFEVGGSVENMDISISTNAIDWVSLGEISGQPSGIDIDAYIDSGVVLGGKYTYVKIVDLLPETGSYPYSGADIDAVGAISSTDPPPCWGTGCPQATQASTVYGHQTAHKSNILNVLSILLVPMGAVIVLRFWRRKR